MSQRSTKTGEPEDKRLCPLGGGQSKHWTKRIRSPDDIRTDDADAVHQFIEAGAIEFTSSKAEVGRRRPCGS